LLSGVLVPITYLPVGIQPFCKVSFLYWSADILRDSLVGEPSNLAYRLLMLTVLGGVTTLMGGYMLNRMLIRVRTLGVNAVWQ